MLNLLASTPPMNQAQNSWDLTWLYLIPLPLILIWGIRVATRQRSQIGPHKQVQAARMNHSALSQEQDQLRFFRDYVNRTGRSPVGGKSPEQAIADQETEVRRLIALQSDLQSGLPDGGRSIHKKGGE